MDPVYVNKYLVLFKWITHLWKDEMFQEYISEY